ncbi:zinc-binding dehydrogenase [Bacillus sp. V5-8f]|uniref:zinc-dependent alcohol dehydrogenase n=1 Tax=Bacillus sp. V5-8f TaxID=2053044 RepID=UPI000C77526E|nr:alcohol dehydrogenase catalytic domain-containing protein [Bacillus sp. V5-8f]PLT33271.1 sorbitol dehydrogenase [Bacillus sp. V5-8f]
MLGLILKQPGQLELQELQSLSTLKDDEVKIKVIYGGICGSDIAVFKGKLKHASYPVTPGHELVGTIMGAGQDVEYTIGTKVVVLPNSYCGTCDMCVKGKTNICRHKESLGVNADGGFSQEFVISSRFVLPIPEGVPDERAVLIEPFAVIIHAFQKVEMTKDTSVAIIGCGTEGMLAVSLAAYLGAQVTAIDINQDKLENARSFGKIRTAMPDEIKDETFDVVIEAAGVQQSVEQAIQIAAPGGSVVLIGLTPEANVPVVRVVRNELNIYGSIIYNFPSDYTKALEYLMRDDFHVNPIISEIIPFKEYERAYEAAATGKFGKIILDFKEGNGNRAHCSSIR